MKLTKMQKYGERQVKCSGQPGDDGNYDADTSASKMNSFCSLSAKGARFYVHLIPRRIL